MDHVDVKSEGESWTIRLITTAFPDDCACFGRKQEDSIDSSVRHRPARILGGAVPYSPKPNWAYIGTTLGSQGKYSYFRLKHEYVTGCSGSRPAQIGYWIVDCQPFRAAPVPLVLPRTCAATSRTGISPLLRTTRSSSTRFYTCSAACRR